MTDELLLEINIYHYQDPDLPLNFTYHFYPHGINHSMQEAVPHNNNCNILINRKGCWKSVKTWILYFISISQNPSNKNFHTSTYVARIINSPIEKNIFFKEKYPNTVWCRTKSTTGEDLSCFTYLVCYFIHPILHLK